MILLYVGRLSTSAMVHVGQVNVGKGVLRERIIVSFGITKIKHADNALTRCLLHLHQKEVLFGPLAHLSATFSARFPVALKHPTKPPKNHLVGPTCDYNLNAFEQLTEGG